MVRPVKSREQRLVTLLNGMRHVPESVKVRFEEAFLQADPNPRGMPTALEAFYTYLAESNRLAHDVTSADFEGLSASRTAHRVLLAALRKFAPDVPLAAARPVSKQWDRWLNNRYNQKPKKPRKSTRVALAPECWPMAWQVVIPALDRVVRVDGQRFRKLAPKTRVSVIQAVGMLAVAKVWAEERGVSLDETFSSDLFEAFTRFMLLEREVSARTTADYLERIRIFAARGSLLTLPENVAVSELIGALRDEAREEEPGKRAKVRSFRNRFTLAELLVRAGSRAIEADMAPDGSAEAERKRRTALILALLVNTGDRQGDLSCLTIGKHVRREDGLWSTQLHQSKTGRWKELGPLWSFTSALIDAHILAGRPHWQLEDRVQALNGSNLLSLSGRLFNVYYPTAILKEEFGISGHLVRTLVTDLIRTQRPNAAWAAKEILGHSDKWMQTTYQTDFRATASVNKWHELLAEIQETKC